MGLRAIIRILRQFSWSIKVHIAYIREGGQSRASSTLGSDSEAMPADEVGELGQSLYRPDLRKKILFFWGTKLSFARFYIGRSPKILDYSNSGVDPLDALHFLSGVRSVAGIKISSLRTSWAVYYLTLSGKFSGGGRRIGFEKAWALCILQ